MVQSERLLKGYPWNIRRNLKANVYRLFRRLCRISLTAPRTVIKHPPFIRISVMTVPTLYHHTLILTFPRWITVSLKFLSTARRFNTTDIAHACSDISFFSVIFVCAEYRWSADDSPPTPPCLTPYWCWNGGGEAVDVLNSRTITRKSIIYYR